MHGEKLCGHSDVRHGGAEAWLSGVRGQACNGPRQAGRGAGARRVLRWGEAVEGAPLMSSCEFVDRRVQRLFSAQIDPHHDPHLGKFYRELPISKRIFDL